MAELAKKLHFLKNGTEQTAKAYSTPTEAGEAYITNKIDNIIAYIPIGEISNTEATIGRVTQNGTKAILKSGKVPYTKKEYRTPNSYTFTVPANVSKLRVTLLGAGGGGAGGRPAKDAAVGGGGGGYFINNAIIAVTPLSTLPLSVGAGGAGGSSGNDTNGRKGVDGGSSSLGDLIAGGGGAGDLLVPGAGGTGSGGVEGKQGSFPNGGNSGAGDAGGTSVGANGADGAGGAGGHASTKGGNGGNGYVIIEYGGDIY